MRFVNQQLSERAAGILGASTGFFGFGINATMQFLLPLRAVELGYSLVLVGLLLGTKALVEGLLSIPVGDISSRLGARNVFRFGAFGVVVIGLGFLYAENIVLLFLVQASLGVFRPFVWVGAQAYVAGHGKEDDRSRHAANFSFSANSAQIIVPGIAGMLAENIGVRHGFILLVMLGLIFSLIGVGLPEQTSSIHRSHETRGQGKTIRAAGSLLQVRDMQAVMYFTFARLFIPAIWVSFFPVLLLTGGNSAAFAGLLVSLMGFLSTIVSLAVGRIPRTFPPVHVTGAGLALAGLGLVIAPWGLSVEIAVMSAVFIGIGQGVSLPMLLVIVGTAVPSPQRSLALGLRASVNQAASMSGPILMGWMVGLAGFAGAFPIAAVMIWGLVALGLRRSGRRTTV